MVQMFNERQSPTAPPPWGTPLPCPTATTGPDAGGRGGGSDRHLDALHGNIGEEGLLLCLAVVEYLNGLIIRGPHFDEPRQQIGLAVVACPQSQGTAMA